MLSRRSKETDKIVEPFDLDQVMTFPELITTY